MVNSNDVQQWGYLLNPTFQFVNTAGKPLTEGYIEVYIAGTRDKYYCASDFDGTLHPFQIPLDSLGANIVLADPEQAYDVYVYNKFGSLQMSRYNVSPGNAGGAVASNINITSSDNTVNVTHTGNNYDLSIQDTIDRIDNLENVVSGITGETDYVISTGYGDGGTFVLTDKEYKGIQYLSDMSGWRLKPGHIYQFNFNSKFTLDDNYNTLVEGRLYLDGDMSFSQDWAYSLDDSFDHIKHINGSTVIVVPDTLQYYDLKLKYTFNSVVNCQVDLENASLVDITSIVINNGGSGSDYHAGDGININSSNYISVDMDYINNQIDIDSKLSSAINIANQYTDNSIEEVVALVTGVTGELHQVNSDWEATSGVAEILNKPDLSIYATHQEVINSVSAATAVLEQEIQDIPEQVQSDWAQTDTDAVDYIKNKPDLDVYATHSEVYSATSTAIASANSYTDTEINNLNIEQYATHNEVYTATSSAVSSANSYTDTAISNIDLSDYSTHTEVYNATTSAVSSANSYTDTAISNIDLSDYSTHTEVYNATTSAVSSANSYTDTAINNIDFSDYATHTEVYNSTVTAIASANSYTDEAIANIDLTPAVEIVSPNSSISVSSVVDSANNTKTFYIDTNNPGVNYWLGDARLTLSDQSSQGQVGYYKEVFDYADKLNGNLDATKLKKGLYLLTANVMVVADEVNNDLAEIQILSNSTSAISNTNSIFQHDCSVVGDDYEPGEVSHQIATIVRVMYDDTPMSLIARLNAPTYISNELHLWFCDIGLYELQGTTIGGGSSPSASGSYDAGWGIVINGNVISVNQNIIPDISNLASTTYVDNRIASAIDIVEGEIPDVSDMATKTWVNNQGYLTSQVQSDWTESNSSDPAYIKNKPLEGNLIAGNNITITASGNNITISSTASSVSYAEGTGIDITGNVISVDDTVAMKTDIPDVTDMATKTWVNNQGFLTSVPSYYATDTEVANAIATAVSAIPGQVQSDWTEDDTSDPSYIQNKPQTEAITVSTLVAGDNITITASGDNVVISSTGGSSGTSYTAGTGIDITNDTISIDSTVALKTDIPDTTDMATKTWVGQQGYLTSVPSSYATDAEVSAAIATAIASVPAQVQSNWTESASASPAYIQNKPTEVSVDFCPIIAGSNITITASGDSAVISSTGGGGGGSTYTAGTGIDITSDVISIDDSVVATKTWVGNQGYLTSVPSTYATDTEVANAIASATNGMATQSWVTSQGYLTSVPSQYITETELSSELADYALASSIPDVSNLATKSELQTVSAAIPDTSDMATKTWVGNQGYLTTIPSTYATDIEVANAIATATSGMATQTWVGSQGYVNSSTASAIAEAEVASVETLPIDICPLIAGENITITATGSSAVISSTGGGGGSTYSAGDYIGITNNTISVTGITDVVAGNCVSITSSGNSAVIDWTTTAGITDIQMVNSLPASPVSTVLYLIPEA